MSATLTQAERRSIAGRGWRLSRMLRFTRAEHELSEALGDALHARRYEDAARHLAAWDAMDPRIRAEIERLFKWRCSPEQVASRLSIRDLEDRMQRLTERPHYYSERHFERLQRTDLPVYRAEYDRRLAACLPTATVATEDLTNIERMRLEAVKRRIRCERV